MKRSLNGKRGGFGVRKQGSPCQPCTPRPLPNARLIDIQDQFHDQLSRRNFLGQSGAGVGAIALASLLNSGNLFGGVLGGQDQSTSTPHFTPKAKRVIYLFQSGAPSQLKLFDYKPKLEAMWGQDLPESVRKGQRLTV